MSTPILLDSYYTKQLQFYYGGSPSSLLELSEYEEALWNTFTNVYHEETGENISTLSMSTDSTKQAFLAFLQRYNLRHVPLDVLKSTNELPETGDNLDFFVNYLNSFYGQYTETEKTNIWNQFLANENLTENPTDSPALRSSFTRFINGMRSKEVRMEAQVAISPTEAGSRLILNEVMSSLSDMMSTIENVVRTQSELLIFYGAWQEQYTTMMTKVPNLIPVSNKFQSIYTTVQIPYNEDVADWDLRSFTFGYNETNLDEVIQWGVDSAMKSPGDWITFGNDEMGHFDFRGVENIGGKLAQVEVRFKYANMSDYETRTIKFFETDGSRRTTQNSLGDTVFMDYDDWTEEANDAFLDIFANLDDVDDFKTYYNTMFERDISDGQGLVFQDSYRLGLEGRFLSSNVDDQDFEQRAEQNAILQQYVEGIRSLRTLVSDRTKQLQLSLADAKEGVNKITSLWTSILEMIDNVIKSIFKEKR